MVSALALGVWVRTVTREVRLRSAGSESWRMTGIGYLQAPDSQAPRTAPVAAGGGAVPVVQLVEVVTVPSVYIAWPPLLSMSVTFTFSTRCNAPAWTVRMALVLGVPDFIVATTSPAASSTMASVTV